MMTYMEIASYLSTLGLILAEANAEGDNPMNDKMLEAVRMAQMILFRMAVDEMSAGKAKGDK